MRAIPKPHPGGILRFGKRKAKRDDRNLMFAALLKAPPSLPTEYDFDVVHYGIPTPIFGNDQYGDCVIAGRAHQPLRFEKAKKNTLIGITDQDVLREYVSETGGSDSGLIVLDSLKECRRKGWRAAKRRHKIKAFTRIDQGKRSEVKRAGFMNIGVGFGFSLPDAAFTQSYAGKPWTVVSGKAGQPNPRNGHYAYVPGYTKSGAVCVTRGRKQQMSWAFPAIYRDEAYAIINAVNTAKKQRELDTKKLEAFVAALRRKAAGKKLAVTQHVARWSSHG
jgi:hypothetical protein